MKLSQLAAKPQLIKLTIDDQDLCARYSNGEPLEFYTWDRQPIDVFMKLASSQGEETGVMIDVVRTLILNEQGEMIIAQGQALPSPILVKAIGMIVETLGK